MNKATRLLDYRPDLDLTFADCLMETAQYPDFVKQFDRLYGTDLAKIKSPLVEAIDKATGHEKDMLDKFADFVWEFVWSTVPPVSDGKS